MNIVAHMMGHQPGPHVISAAGRKSYDDSYGFAFVKRSLGSPLRATQEREDDSYRGDDSPVHD
jgi:hypothetical protein